MKARCCNCVTIQVNKLTQHDTDTCLKQTRRDTWNLKAVHASHEINTIYFKPHIGKIEHWSVLRVIRWTQTTNKFRWHTTTVNNCRMNEQLYVTTTHGIESHKCMLNAWKTTNETVLSNQPWELRTANQRLSYKHEFTKYNTHEE